MARQRFVGRPARLVEHRRVRLDLDLRDLSVSEVEPHQVQERAVRRRSALPVGARAERASAVGANHTLGGRSGAREVPLGGPEDLRMELAGERDRVAQLNAVPAPGFQRPS